MFRVGVLLVLGLIALICGCTSSIVVDDFGRDRIESINVSLDEAKTGEIVEISLTIHYADGPQIAQDMEAHPAKVTTSAGMLYYTREKAEWGDPEQCYQSVDVSSNKVYLRLPDTEQLVTITAEFKGRKTTKTIQVLASSYGILPS